MSFSSNLAARLGTAAVALPALLAAFFLGPPWLGAAVVAAALLLGLAEFARLQEARGLPADRVFGPLLAAAAFADVALPRAAGAPLWPAALALLFTAALRRGAQPAVAIPAAAATALGAGYLGGLGGAAAALRLVAPVEAGAWRLTLLLAIVMSADTLAYLVGHALGRHKLAPAISPAKTVEGALGALAGGALGAVVVRHLGLPDVPLAHAMGLGVLGGALGTAGDLFESLLKRWAGVKDSGALFPGHGGMLDRMDSPLFAAPLLYLYFCLR